MSITPEQKQLLHDMKNTSYGHALAAFLEDGLKEIGDIKSCQSWEETLGRKYALQLLKDLFSFMGEKKSPEKSKNIYI